MIDYLEVVGGKVSKDQIIDFLSGNAIRIEEHIKSDSFKDEPGYEERVSYLRNLSPKELTEEYEDVTGDDSGLVNDIEGMVNEILSAESESGDPINKTKYSKYVVPGGSNYKELLITLPKELMPKDIPAALVDFPYDDFDVSFDNTRPEGMQWSVIPVSQTHGQPYKGIRAGSAKEVKALALDAINMERVSAARNSVRNESFTSSHWDEKNILVHVRFDERTDADGKKVLFIIEIQSDWGQEGKKKGNKEGR